jgi:site-specific DNA-methyltransferase (adenine-specific)
MNSPVIIGTASLYLGDCMKYMATLPDNAFDLAIVDPPYGINAPAMSMGQNLNRDDGFKRTESTAVKIRKGRLNSGGGKLKNRLLNTSDIDWDDEPPPAEYWKELFRVSKHQIIFGANYFMEHLRSSRGVGFWNKCQPWENFSQFELIWTSFDCPAFEIKYSNTGGANKETKIHPTQKPVEVYKYLINKFAKTGNKIIDTHLGSGSSVVAAIDMGFDISATEKRPDYFDNLVKRVAYENQQVRLFA